MTAFCSAGLDAESREGCVGDEDGAEISDVGGRSLLRFFGTIRRKRGLPLTYMESEEPKILPVFPDSPCCCKGKASRR